MKPRPLQFSTAELRALYAVGSMALGLAQDGHAPRFMREGGPLQRAVAELSRTLAEVDFVSEPKRRRRA